MQTDGDRAARDVIARVSEWADGMPGASDAERLARIRELVRTYERDHLGIVAAPPAVATGVASSEIETLRRDQAAGRERRAGESA